MKSEWTVGTLIIALLVCITAYGQKSSEWTVETLKEHFEALRAADQRALQIKEQGDEKALDLAREIQVYKDEKANELREQINQERNLYVRVDQLKPINDYMATHEGRSEGLKDYYGYIVAAFAIGFAIWDRRKAKVG